MSTLVAILLNPKTNELVEVHARRNNIRIGFLGSPESVGDAYTAEEGGPDNEFLRIHSPNEPRGRADFSGVSERLKGQGYGLMLYVGAAIAVWLNTKHEHGVFSIQGDRSEDAELLWDSLVRHEIAKADVVEHRRDITVRHCEDITDPDVDDYTITDDEVCANVNAERVREVEVTYIDGGEMIDDQDFVLWVRDNNSNHKLPPAELIARIKVKDRSRAEWIAKYLRANYDDEIYYQAFISRADVLELFGQERLPGISGPLHNPRVPLPPLSARAVKLKRLFDDVP